MKQLSDYIQEDYFYDETYWHLIMSFGEFYENRFFEGKTPPEWLKHDAGIICNEILLKLKNHNFKNFYIDIDLSKLRNGKIFNKLRVKIEFSKSNNYTEGTVTSLDKYDTNVVLTVRIPVNNIDEIDLCSSIAHELLHRYVYYLNGSDKNNNSIFVKRLNRLSYNKLSFYKSEIENFVKGLVYYTNTDEFNAFFNQLAVEIKDTCCMTADQAYEVLKNNQIYKIYVYLKQTLEGEYADKRQEICDIYRSLVKDDETLSNKRIIYKLKDRLKKLERKMWREVPEFCTESKILSKIRMREFILSLGERFKKD